MASELFRKYIWLVDVIHRHGPLTFAEINSLWHKSSLCNGRDMALRTFHRHREAVEDIFHIRIACDEKTNEYYIENAGELGKNDIANWMLNSFSMANMLCESSAMTDRVIVEDIPSAQKFLTDLLTAMRENRRVKISYQPFYGDEPFELELQPLFVKLYERRWYLYADKPTDAKIKLYALDRMQAVAVQAEQFELPDGFSPAEYLKDAFGVAVYDDIKPCTIRIRAWGKAVKYLQTLPLHHSQRECVSIKGTVDLFDSTIFEYFVAPTPEFYNAVLSREGIEIISPYSVRKCVNSRATSIYNKHMTNHLDLHGNLFKQLSAIDNRLGRLAIQARFNDEHLLFEPLEDDNTNDNIVILLRRVAEALRNAEIVLNPGYGFMADSMIMNLAGITAVSPIANNDWADWNDELPFSRFKRSFKNGCTLTLETGTGGIEVARKVLDDSRDVLIIESDPGVFEFSYIVKRSIENLTVKIIEYAPLDRIRHVCSMGWRRLDDTVLDIFRTGRTGDVIGFGSEGMRKWLVEFQPESMSDLCMLYALYHPVRMPLYNEILRRKQHPETIVYPDDREERKNILRETYGVLVYQEQALALKRVGIKADKSLKELALKGHTIARTMIAIESARSCK